MYFDPGAAKSGGIGSLSLSHTHTRPPIGKTSGIRLSVVTTRDASSTPAAHKNASDGQRAHPPALRPQGR